MYLDFKEGIKKAKDGAIIWKTFGVLAAVFLVLFFVCSGIAKIIMGVIFGLLMLFILVTFCIGFIQRGNRKENKEIQERIKADFQKYQQLCMDPANTDFMSEFASWYLLWSNGKYDSNSTGSKLTNLGLNLQICKHNGKGVFEECIDLFREGVSIDSEDKTAIIDAAIRLSNSNKDIEREEIKKEIINIISKYS